LNSDALFETDVWNTVALTALKNVRMLQKDLILVSGQQSQLELHINSLESASLNMETVNVMKNAAKALKAIHGNMHVESHILIN